MCVSRTSPPCGTLEQSNFWCGGYGLLTIPEARCGSLSPIGYPELGGGYFFSASTLLICLATITWPPPLPAVAGPPCAQTVVVSTKSPSTPADMIFSELVFIFRFINVSRQRSQTDACCTKFKDFSAAAPRFDRLSQFCLAGILFRTREICPAPFFATGRGKLNS